MKRIIAVLLALTMVFALCGCGSKELTDAEKEKIYEEVAKEKAEKAYSNAQSQPSSSQETGSPKYEGLERNQMDGNAVTYMAPYPIEDDYISVDDIKLVKTNDGKYRPDVLFTNHYQERVPDTVNVYCNYLNEKGEIIENFCFVLGRLGPDQSIWTSAMNYSHSNGDDKFNLSEVAEIQFVHYEMLCILSAQDVWYQDFAFLTPISFKVADLI